MAAGIARQVADALVTDLNAGSFTESFTATRSYAGWQLKLKNLSTTRVDVVPVSLADMSLDADDKQNSEAVVDIVMRKRLGQSDVESDGAVKNTVLDPLSDTVEEIAAFLADPANRRPSTYDEATLETVEILHLYVLDHLPAQFTGVIRTRYQHYGDF